MLRNEAKHEKEKNHRKCLQQDQSKEPSGVAEAKCENRNLGQLQRRTYTTHLFLATHIPFCQYEVLSEGIISQIYIKRKWREKRGGENA